MKAYYSRLLLFIATLALGLFVCNSCGPKEQPKEDILWYKQAANNWNEALPLGNGNIGVMVFGQTSRERIQLNDDSMWPADVNEWIEPEGDTNDLESIRALLIEGKHEDADRLFVDKFSRKSIVRSHQTLGDLFIDFDHQNITDYRRELNLSTAVSKVSYKADGYPFAQEIFVSKPHRAIVIKLSSASPEGLNAKLSLSRPYDHGHQTATSHTIDGSTLVMQGEVTQRGGKFDSKPFPIDEGVKFETRLKINHQGGSIRRAKDFLELQDVKNAVVIIVSNSSYYHDNYSIQNEMDLQAIGSKTYSQLTKEHIDDYQSLYSRVDFRLSKDDLDSIPTDQRLERVKEGVVDLGLESLLFHYGRYLLIASSRPGSNPANLQGLWNEHIQAPWNADYHLNINLQMNYWLADVCNLGELNQPLFDYIDKLVDHGRITADKNFGCRGSFIPHASDLWAPTWLRAPTAYWGCSVGAGGWLMQHYWQHYSYTLDKKFLRERAFPAIQEVASFYSDWIIEDPRDGSLISAPSTSPENQFYYQEGKQAATCLGSAMDQQVIYEVFLNYLKASEILSIKNDLTTTIRNQIRQLRPGFVLDTNGRILEWDRPYEEPEPGHRHMSHLYGFHPGTQISQEKNPELFNAVRNTLDYRLENGGAGTGWSRAWLINCSARLLDGAMAHEHIQQMLRKSISNNLFDLHPPFQIDGNFGYTAGVAEMLLQSHEENTIRVLPALPDSWKEGHIKGLKARGGLSTDIHWNNGQLESVKIHSKYTSSFNLKYGDNTVPVSMKPGETYVYENNKRSPKSKSAAY